MNRRTVDLPPSLAECHDAVARATVARLDEYRRADPPIQLTNSAMQERLTGFPLPNAQQGADGWWRVGTIVDQIADKELNVWYRFGPPRALATSERPGPAFVEPKRPTVVPDGIQALYRSQWASRGEGSGS